MSKKEFACMLAGKLKKEPTKQTILTVVKSINEASISGRLLSAEEKEEILKLMESELGDYGVISESFDNQATVTVMSEVRKIIAQANAGGNKK